LRYTIEHNGCISFDDIVVTNNEPSNANAGANKVICVDSIMLSASTPVVGAGIWTIQSGSATIHNPTDPNSKVTNLSQGINVFRWTVEYNGCTKYDEVTIKNALVVAEAGIDQTVCSQSTVLEANNPNEGIGSWSVLGGSGSANFEAMDQPDTRVTGLDKGTNVLRWTITNDICISYDEVNITNDLPSEAFAGPDQSLCTNEATLQANAPLVGTGEWSVLSGSATIADPTNPNTTVSNLSYGVNTLRWTITNGTCTSTDEVVLNNNGTEISSAGIDQTLCTDSTLLYANKPSFGQGQWSVVSGSATFTDNNNHQTQVKDLGKGENVLRWSISNGTCASTDEVTIINNSPTTAIAGADQTICGNHTYLQANTPSIGAGSWSLVSGAATFANINQNNTEVTGLNPGSNTLRWTIESNGCISQDEVIIYNDLPFEADAGEDFAICGNSAPLYANDPGTGTGQWMVISGSGNFDDASNFNATVSDLGFGANTLRWTITYDQCTTYDEIVVTNNAIEVNAGSDQTVNESTTLLVASNPSAGTGQWTVIGGSGTFQDASNPITEVDGLGAGLNTFRWSVDVNGCISYDDVTVTYNVPPTASFVISKSAGCPPLEVYFVNNSLDNLEFAWDFDDGTSSQEVTIKHTYESPGIYRPSITVLAPNGEQVTKDTLITVYDQPQASMLVVDKEVYIPDEQAAFISTSSNAYRYLWEFGDNQTSEEQDPKHTYETAGVYDVALHVWSENNCYDSIRINNALEVIESGKLQFPNAFTPSTEGPSYGYYNPDDFSNDVFFPIGEGVAEYHLEIFNKWGILVFESNDITIGWDGYRDEELMEEGVYVYKVSGTYNNGKPFNQIGTVLLLRQ
jgi:PKD repeat protein